MLISVFELLFFFLLLAAIMGTILFMVRITWREVSACTSDFRWGNIACVVRSYVVIHVQCRICPTTHASMMLTENRSKMETQTLRAVHGSALLDTHAK